MSRLAQMKLQDLDDDGKVSPGVVTQKSLNKNRTMPQLEVSINGILKLLNNPKPGKASGPEKIRPLILKELRVALAPIIKVIFERPLEKGKLPADWCRANVTPILDPAHEIMVLIALATSEAFALRTHKVWK